MASRSKCYLLPKEKEIVNVPMVLLLSSDENDRKRLRRIVVINDSHGASSVSSPTTGSGLRRDMASHAAGKDDLKIVYAEGPKPKLRISSYCALMVQALSRRPTICPGLSRCVASHAPWEHNLQIATFGPRVIISTEAFDQLLFASKAFLGTFDFRHLALGEVNSALACRFAPR